MNSSEMLDIMIKNAEDASKKYEGTDKINYAFAFGYFCGDVRWLLVDLKLTDEQLAIFDKRVGYYVNDNAESI